MAEHILIEAVEPAVDGGRYPAKVVVGEPVVVEADVFRDGPALLRAVVKWKKARERSFHVHAMAPVGDDRFRGVFTPDENTRYQFTVEAWTDAYGTWLEQLGRWVRARVPVEVEVREGVALLEGAAAKLRGAERGTLVRYARELETLRGEGEAALRLASSEEIVELMARSAPRPDRVAHAPALNLIVDRERAAFGAWYELFPRSAGAQPGVHGTFRDAEARLPALRDMGFDVIYLPPVHPIGRKNRKGRENAVEAAPGDVGSPWAIGGEEGGHTAVHPQLGTLADFDHFVSAARALDMEVALDFAIQASPDHPWIKEHPDWFTRRPDGSIKYAENPPKKYQDVHPVDFDTADERALWSALRDVVWFWVQRGVRIFRVDNPHTKPFPFWGWLIHDVQERDPGVIFLAEAFTRPKPMRALAKLGFTQSYTYFTWRNTKHELMEYMADLLSTKHYLRPNFFANTPDILPTILQHGGRAAFQMRLVLAATLSPTYGIYSGYELCEARALPGREEYADSEKYRVHVRDWQQPGNIIDLVRTLNQVRRDNPALRRIDTLRFFHSDDEHILVYGKRDAGNAVIVCVNCDPFAAHHANVDVPMDWLGRPWGSRYEVLDRLTGERWSWGERNWVRLDPRVRVPAHVFEVR